jgi:hypothetical protein
MSGMEVLAVASLAATAAGAYSQYEGAKTQASMGMAAAGMKKEQIEVERQTIALRAREEEAERQRRAGILDGEVQAGAAYMGYDPFSSGTTATLRGSNARLVDADVSSIRLLGSARQRSLAIQGRGNELEADTYRYMDQNAWIRPTLSMISGGINAYQIGTRPTAPSGSGATGGGAKSATVSNTYTGTVTTTPRAG